MIELRRWNEWTPEEQEIKYPLIKGHQSAVLQFRLTPELKAAFQSMVNHKYRHAYRNQSDVIRDLMIQMVVEFQLSQPDLPGT